MGFHCDASQRAVQVSVSETRRRRSVSGPRRCYTPACASLQGCEGEEETGPCCVRVPGESLLGGAQTSGEMPADGGAPHLFTSHYLSFRVQAEERAQLINISRCVGGCGAVVSSLFSRGWIVDQAKWGNCSPRPPASLKDPGSLNVWGLHSNKTGRVLLDILEAQACTITDNIVLISLCIPQ